jgi:facilitated trehalose transporter
MVGLGSYFAYKYMCVTANPPTEVLYGWVPVACIMAFTLTGTLGYQVVPFVMMGEMYPQKVSEPIFVKIKYGRLVSVKDIFFLW